MKNVIDYEIVSGSESYVVKMVRNKIKDGWTPIGSVSIEGATFAQSMVKYEEPKTGKPEGHAYIDYAGTP